MTLTAKQKAFISEYLTDFNATRAAERAGYKGDANTLAVTGHDLLRNPKIADAVSARLSAQAMSADEVLNRLAAQARASMNDFVRFNENGDPEFDLQAASVMGKLHLAKKLKTKTRSWSEPTLNIATMEIEQRDMTETAIEFELYDAQAALVHIGRHHKLFTDMSETKSEIEINDATDARERIASRIASIAQRNAASGDPEGSDA